MLLQMLLVRSSAFAITRAETASVIKHLRAQYPVTPRFRYHRLACWFYCSASVAYTHHSNDYAPSTAPLLGSATLDAARNSLAKAWRYAQQYPMETINGLYTVAVATLLALVATAAVSIAVEVLRAEQALLVVNVVLEHSANKVQTETALGLLRRIEGVDSLTVFSPEQTQRHFAERFGNDMDKLLAESPFVTAVVLHLEPELRTTSGLSAIAAQAKTIKSVSDVQYHEQFAQATDTRAAQTAFCSWLGGAVVSMAVIALLAAGLRRGYRQIALSGGSDTAQYRVSAAVSIPHSSYPLVVAFVGIAVGAIIGVSLWLGFAERLPWLANAPRLPFIGVLGVLALVSIFIVLLQITVLVDERLPVEQPEQ
jgi:hypothetical protein